MREPVPVQPVVADGGGLRHLPLVVLAGGPRHRNSATLVGGMELDEELPENNDLRPRTAGPAVRGVLYYGHVRWQQIRVEF